ncbi:hypothetical protein AB0I42_37260, partial [Polymorphospora sp. NPDC050346]
PDAAATSCSPCSATKPSTNPAPPLDEPHRDTLQPSHALAEQEAIVCELATQALWTYSAHINAEAENGRDPQVPDRYDWRFLRAMRRG